MANQHGLKRMYLSAVFLASGMVLPLLTGQIKEIGDSLLPMHFAALLCGFICGGGWGTLVGFVLPFFRSIIFSMPPIYPNAIWMSAELATYGAVSGALYYCFKKKTMPAVYISLVCAQLAGRIMWAIAKTILMGISGKTFTLTMFFVGGFLDAIPGIMLQLLLIPLILLAVKRKI